MSELIPLKFAEQVETRIESLAQELPLQRNSMPPKDERRVAGRI